ncbi:MAG: NHLP leader peptide family RiPP precursor [Holophaga sp.]
MSTSDMSIAEFILDKAMKEPAFRRSLLASPRKAMETALGRPLPKDLKLSVHEDTQDTVHLVLPPRQQPLPDAQLQGVAAAGEALESCGRGLASSALFNAPGSCGSWAVK